MVQGMVREMRHLGLAFLAALGLFVSSAFGQSNPAGKFTAGHAVKALNPGGNVQGDAGGVTPGSTTNYTGLSELGITNSGTGLGLNSAATNAVGGYRQLGLGFDANGNALISFNAFGGASQTGFNLNLNGITYPFPGTGNGNVVGPISTTSNNSSVWNNSVGTLLADSGVGVSTTTGLNVYVSKAGTDTGNCQQSGSPCLTISYALSKGLLFDIKGGNLVVNFQGSGDWAEDAFINNQLRGTPNKAAIPNIGSTWPSMVLFLGNGSSNTAISGTGGLCATIAASQFAVVGIKNLTVSGGKIGCHSPLFAQLGGTIHVFGGNVIGAAGATSDQLHSENPGSSIQIWENYTMSGGGGSGFGVSTQASILISAGVGTISGSPAYGTSFIFARNGGSLQSNIAAPWGASPVATGAKFFILSNAVIEIPSITAAQIPGNAQGQVTSGARVRGPISATIGSQSGLGTGTAALDFGTPYVGSVTLSPTGSPGATGTSNVTTPYFISSFSGGQFGTCVASTNTGTGSWGSGARAEALVTSQSNIQLNWSNAGGALSAGQTYKIAYICTGD